VKSTSRERLLEAAATLTYQDGVNIGVDALCKAAGVSKRSMYQLFHSKDDLLAASLEERTAPFVATLLPPADDGRSPASGSCTSSSNWSRRGARPPSEAAGTRLCRSSSRTRVTLRARWHTGSRRN
jgi:AcrR family transcriptional regulator